MAETPKHVTVYIKIDTRKFRAAMREATRSARLASRAFRRFVKYADIELPHRTAMHAAYDHRRRARGRRRRNRG